jgi:flagellar hook-length control protein FliK
LSDFFQQLMSELDITPDSLNETMNELGMEPSDLLTEDGMKSLFLAVNSSEVSDLLVNEDLNQDWNGFAGQMNQLLEDMDIPVEELQLVADSWDEDTLLKVETLQTKDVNDFDVSDFSVEKDADVTQSKQIENVDVVVSDDVSKQSNQTQSDSEGFSEDFSDKAYKGAAEDSKSVNTENAKDSKTEHFENPILQAVENAVDNLQEAPVVEEVPISGREIVDQIVEQVKVRMNQDTTSMEMQLYPEHLGKIQINVVSKDGAMTARIVAETEEAKQAIENGLSSLKESMENQNLKVDAIEVMVSTAGFTWNNEEQPEYEQQKSSNSRKKIDLSELEEEETEVEETAELEKMRYAGSSVSYTA